MPVYGQVNAFELTERSGKPMTEQDLRNRVWVAGLIFTSCPSQCPLMIQSMLRVQNDLKLKGNFRMVAISVDPENDTPEKLKAYADQVGAHPKQFLFLTGDKEAVQRLGRDDFKLSSVEKIEGEIVHSSKLVLVDGLGRVRGYFEASDPSEVKNLIRAARKLLRESF